VGKWLQKVKCNETVCGHCAASRLRVEQGCWTEEHGMKRSGMSAMDSYVVNTRAGGVFDFIKLCAGVKNHDSPQPAATRRRAKLISSRWT